MSDVVRAYEAKLAAALLERGHTPQQIHALSPRDRLNEFLEWEGIVGWTDLILGVAQAAGVVIGAGRNPETGRA